MLLAVFLLPWLNGCVETRGIVLVDCTPKGGTNCGGLLALGTVLHHRGHDVTILDGATAHVTGGERTAVSSRQRRIRELILESEPRMALFYTFSGNYLDTLRVAQAVRRKSPETRILFGGPQASATAEESMAAFDFIDLVCVGEADETVADIVRFMDGEVGGVGIPNLLYRDGGKIVRTPRSRRLPDVSSLPWPDYSLVGGPAGEATPLDVGRGCPFACRFCSTSGFHDHRFRLRPVEGIVAEMQRLHARYGCDVFALTHDHFTANRKLVLRFCSLVRESKLDVRWGCSARVDALDDDLIDAMAAAGCYRVFLGVESGSPRMQLIARKRQDVSAVPRVISALVRHGIVPAVSFIYGFPEETEEDLQMTAELLMECIELGVDEPQLHRLAYFPGTPYHQQERENLSFRDDLGLEILDMVGRPLTAWDVETVRKHPAIFPFCYESPTPVLAQYGMLRAFHMNQHFTLVRLLPQTYAALLRHYGRDLLGLYRDFRGLVPDAIEKACLARKRAERDYESWWQATEASITTFLTTAGGILPERVAREAMRCFAEERARIPDARRAHQYAHRSSRT